MPVSRIRPLLSVLRHVICCEIHWAGALVAINQRDTFKAVCMCSFKQESIAGRYVFAVALLVAATCTRGDASTFYLDADPGGTTSNVNIQSAVFNGTTVTDWGSYRDYRFQLVASPQASVSDFALRLSVNKSSSFSAPLNVTWFADSITPYAVNADYTTALGTVSASSIPPGAFAAYIVGPGPFASSLTIPTTKTAYWVRIWAATTGGNDKYQTKLAPNPNLAFATDASNVTMYNWNGTGFNVVAAGTSPNINPVPEPAGIVSAGIGIAVAALAMRRRLR